MANTIRIKRSTTTNSPVSLLQGELAFSEDDSPNGLHQLFIGTASSTITTIMTDDATTRGGTAAAPNDSAQDNQTITTGLGLDGADAGSAANLTIDFAPVELTNVAPVAADQFVFNDATDDAPKKQVASSIPLSIFNNDAGWEANQTLTSGVGISGAEGGSTGNVTFALDFAELTDMTAAVTGSTEIILQDAGTESRKTINEIDLSPFNNDITRVHGTYDFDSATAAADPGAGELRYNNATPGSVTEIYINDAELYGDDYAATLSQLQANDIIIIKSLVDPADWIRCQLDTNPTDNTGWWTWDVTVLGSGSLPTAGDALEIQVQYASGASNQTITTGLGIDGADAGSSGNITITLATTELTNVAPVAGDQFVFNDATDETPKKQTASSIPLSIFNNDSGWEANQTITTGTGIDGADAGSTGNVTLSLAFDEVGVTTATAADWIMFDDAGTSSKFLISGFDVGLFSNATAEYVSENDTIVVVDWNWVLDEDTMSSDSAVHVPTQQSVKAYVDSAVTGGLVYKGGFDPTAGAGAGSPDLDAITSTTGDTYTVTVAGTYNWTTGSAVLEVGDVLIAEADGVLNNVNQWTIVQNNIGQASETAAGYAEIATTAEADGGTDDLRIITSLKLHATTFDGGSF